MLLVPPAQALHIFQPSAWLSTCVKTVASAGGVGSGPGGGVDEAGVGAGGIGGVEGGGAEGATGGDGEGDDGVAGVVGAVPEPADAMAGADRGAGAAGVTAGEEARKPSFSGTPAQPTSTAATAITRNQVRFRCGCLDDQTTALGVRLGKRMNHLSSALSRSPARLRPALGGYSRMQTAEHPSVGSRQRNCGQFLAYQQSSWKDGT